MKIHLTDYDALLDITSPTISRVGHILMAYHGTTSLTAKFVELETDKVFELITPEVHSITNDGIILIGHIRGTSGMPNAFTLRHWKCVPLL